MNDFVDMARDALKQPEVYDQDLVQMLKNLIAGGVAVKVCGTCMVRCGIYKNDPSTMKGHTRRRCQNLPPGLLIVTKSLHFSMMHAPD